MNLLSKVCIVLIACALSCTQNPVEQPIESLALTLSLAPAPAIENQYIVVFKDNTIDVHNAISGINVELLHTYDYVFKGFSAKLSPQLYENLINNPDVLFIDRDDVFFFALTWFLGHSIFYIIGVLIARTLTKFSLTEES